jgi:hypothetical protein
LKEGTTNKQTNKQSNMRNIGRKLKPTWAVVTYSVSSERFLFNVSAKSSLCTSLTYIFYWCSIHCLLTEICTLAFCIFYAIF